MMVHVFDRTIRNQRTPEFREVSEDIRPIRIDGECLFPIIFFPNK